MSRAFELRKRECVINLNFLISSLFALVVHLYGELLSALLKQLIVT